MLTNIAKRYLNKSGKIRTGLYAGSFDPPSSGHLDIIERGLSLCDKLYVGVASNAMKKYILVVLSFVDQFSLWNRGLNC